MAVIRRTEKAAHDLFLAGLVKGTTHLAAGHEAVAVGTSAALRPDDYVFATYRGHHHAIARGATAGGVPRRADEQGDRPLPGQGRVDAPDQGIGGNARLVRDRRRAPADGRGRGVVGQARGSGQVAVAFFGDGATNIGAFHEALNIAAVWSLPVLFVCENNLYMEYTPIGSVTPVAQSGRRPRAGVRDPGRGDRRQRCGGRGRRRRPRGRARQVGGRARR